MTTLCPCCKRDWPGPDRIAFLGRMVITPLGWRLFQHKTALIIRDCHERRGGIPVAEMIERTKDPKWPYNANYRLEKLGWRFKRITRPDGTDVWGVVENLRNEKGSLCRAVDK